MVKRLKLKAWKVRKFWGLIPTFVEVTGGNFTSLPLPCWFSLYNSETVKAATLALCSIQYSYLAQVTRYWAWVFLISGFLVNPLQTKIVITLQPVMLLTWNLDQQLNLTRNTKERRKNLTMTLCRQIGTRHWKFSNFWPIRTYLFITSNLLYFKKNENRTKKSLTQIS